MLLQRPNKNHNACCATPKHFAFQRHPFPCLLQHDMNTPSMAAHAHNKQYQIIIINKDRALTASHHTRDAHTSEDTWCNPPRLTCPRVAKGVHSPTRDSIQFRGLPRAPL